MKNKVVKIMDSFEEIMYYVEIGKNAVMEVSMSRIPAGVIRNKPYLRYILKTIDYEILEDNMIMFSSNSEYSIAKIKLDMNHMKKFSVVCKNDIESPDEKDGIMKNYIEYVVQFEYKLNDSVVTMDFLIEREDRTR